jgi:hydroxymethylbilane synthase
MTSKFIRIGTRESQLAVWQATTVQQLLETHGYRAELHYIKSDGDTDLKTPLYEIGVQGIFTRALDIALLNGDIDIAVHSMKDVPTMMAKGIAQAAVLPRASYYDVLVPAPGYTPEGALGSRIIATSSIRRKAQWLHRYPADTLENLRGNVNTRLRKVAESQWHGAIFAAAGLERIGLRPDNAITLDWMLPAPAQGAIMVVSRDGDAESQDACSPLNDADTALCTKIERDFLRALMGGCSTPISALARIASGKLHFEGNVLSVDGKDKKEISRVVDADMAGNIGFEAGNEIAALLSGNVV